MDAIDILGELLGHKTQQSSRGGNILKDIFGRGRSASPPPKKPGEIKRDAEKLEDLLNVGDEKNRGIGGFVERC